MAHLRPRYAFLKAFPGIALALLITGAGLAKAQEAAPGAAPSAPAQSPAAATQAPEPSATVPAAPAEPAAQTTPPAPTPKAPEAPAQDVTAPGDTTTPAATAPPPSTPPASAPLVHAEKLPRDLSPWSMFVSADIVVKAVMIGLIFASVVTWTVWLAKSIELAAATRCLRKGLAKVAAAGSIGEAANILDGQRGVVPAMVNPAVNEMRLSWDSADKAGVKERVAARLERLELAAGRGINRGTGVLATIGSTAPFVGLFGTVWGIMNSFIGISEAQTTNLAIVAPGIAEALLATAFGLVAAIPAVIIYNHFARSIGGYKALVGDTSTAVQCLVSRDFDHVGLRPEFRAAE